MTALEAAHWYLTRRFFPIPVPYRTKAPVLDDWQNLRITAENVAQYFNSGPQNMGVLLGEPDNLCDVDRDAPESHWAWIEYGPATGFIFGRRSNPASHSFYYTDPDFARTAKYLDPGSAGGKGCIIELRSRTSQGKAGLQTIVPPSVHVSGEIIEFVANKSGTPAHVPDKELERAVRLTAAAVILGRHAREGAYHDTFLALAGAFARGGWKLDQAQTFLRACYRVIWTHGADLEAADKEAESSFRRWQDTRDVTGLHTLQQLIELPIYRKLTQWLGLRDEAGGAPPPRPKQLPEAHLLEELRHQVLTTTSYLIEQCIMQPGLTLLTAPSRSGKTVLAVQIAMAAANGEALFEYFKTKPEPTPVLFLEWDDPQGRAALQDFLKKTRAAKPAMPVYWIAPEEDDLDLVTLADAEFFPWFRRHIERTRAGLVVLDSYTALRGYRGGGGDIVKVEAEEIRTLATLARDLHCAMILIHHDSKSSAHLDWADRSAGTYAITAGATALIRIARFPELPEGDGARLVSVRGRKLRGTEFVIRFQPETLDYDWVLEGAAAKDYPSIVELDRHFHNVSFTAKDVQGALGWTRMTTYRTLNRLVLSGVLQKDSGSWKWDPNFDTRCLIPFRKTSG